eukprot:3616763-Pyramimonas_sp.AAC.1
MGGCNSSGEFKTNAFESMSWLTGQALTMLTFAKSYKVEFWNPCYPDRKGKTDTRDPRMLVCMPAHFREYVPLASGTEYHVMTSAENVMVAMLVPTRF